jgi:hypothetical protein
MPLQCLLSQAVTLATAAGPVTLLGPSVDELRPLLLTAQVGKGHVRRAGGACIRFWEGREGGRLQDKPTCRWVPIHIACACGCRAACMMISSVQDPGEESSCWAHTHV